MQDALDRVKAARAEFEAAKAALAANANGNFKKLIAPVFEKYPDLHWFEWKQYTPYFNDGDPCTFSAETSYISASYGSDAKADESDDEDDDDNEVDTGDDAKPWAVEIGNVLGGLGDEVLQAMFGDHVAVRIVRQENGQPEVKIREYEHD